MRFDGEPSIFFFLFLSFLVLLLIQRSVVVYSFTGALWGFHWKIDTADDEHYDIEVKVAKNEREILVFGMEMNISLSLCQNFSGS